MTQKDKKLTTQVIVGVIVFLAVWFVVYAIKTFLDIWFVQIAAAAVLTWALLSLGDQLGLPGYGKAKPAAKPVVKTAARKTAKKKK
jgi:membrane protease YdiL (CAAX protease family)